MHTLSPRAANVPALLARFTPKRIALRLVAPRHEARRARDGALPTLDELLRMPRMRECHARFADAPPTHAAGSGAARRRD